MKTVCFPYGPLGSNMYVLFFDNGYVVIDPSCDPLMVKDYINEHNEVLFENLKAVFMTHGHFDHVMHVDSWKNLFPDVPFYIGKDDLDMLERTELNCSYDFGSPISFGATAISFESVGDRIELSDSVSCEIIHTPGHTNGHVVILCSDKEDETSLMYSGDMLFKQSIGRTDLPTGNILKMKVSIDCLKKLSVDAIVLPGHGPSTTLSDEIENNPYFI